MDENKQDSPQSAQPVDMDDFDAGFNDGIEADTPDESLDRTLPVVDEPEQVVPEQAVSEQVTPEQVLPEQVTPAPAPAQVTPAQYQQSAPVAPVEINEAIADEYGELLKLSPQAAALAREDSPEGAAIRDRLGRMGADSAFDRAEVLLERRERAAQEANAQQQAIEAYNRNFQHILRNEHPDLFAPERTQEQNQRFMGDVRAWIETKPYAEARGLMDVYENGRDPRQVAALISRFKHESGASGTPGAPVVSTAGACADVYPVLYLGKNAFATIPFARGAGGSSPIVPTVLRPNTPRGGDPLGQRGTIGWKMWHGGVILYELYMARAEVAVTAL